MVMDELKLSERTWLGDLARAELEQLQREGISPTWDQVVRINDLARKVERPRSRSISATGKPVWVDNYLLWPFTIAAAEWYGWAFDVLGEDDRIFALIYAHANAREDVFTPIYDESKARSTLKAFRRTLHCTLSEVAEAIAELMGDDIDADVGESDKDQDDDGFEEIVAKLVAGTGIEPEIWKHRVSLQYAVAQIDACNARDDESAREWKTDYVRAEKALGVALMEIRQSV